MKEAPRDYPLPQTHEELMESFAPHNIDPDSYVVLAGNGNPALSEAVGKLLGTEVTFPSNLFPNREDSIEIRPNLRSRNVFVLQSMYPDPDVRLAELTLIGSTIKRADANNARAILPKIAYDRQDRKVKSRTPISIADVAKQLEEVAKFRSLYTVDIHNEASMATFDGPWDNSHASRVLVPALLSFELDDPVVLSPDAGGGKRAEDYSDGLGGADLAMVYKRKKKKNEVLFLAGDVKGRDVFIPDDVGATGTSLVNAAQKAKEEGANKVLAAVTHLENVPDEDGIRLTDRLNQPDCPLDMLLTTDTIFQAEEVRNHDKIRVYTVAPIIAVAILCYMTGESMGQRLFETRED